MHKVAYKLEIGTPVSTAALNDLTYLLEQYRLAEIEKKNVNEDKRKIMSVNETKEAQSYLSAPNLMDQTKEDIGRAGVIGEENKDWERFKAQMNGAADFALDIKRSIPKKPRLGR